jgi:hypothetical protein
VPKAALELKHAAAAGEMLGRVHRCLAEMRDLGFRRFTLRWPRDAWIERLDGIARAVQMRGGHPDDAFVLQRIHDQCDWLADELDDGARAWGCMSDHYVWALEEVYLQGNERARRFIPLPFRPFARAWQAAKPSSGGF